ncbi:MAG: hypothetical protein ACR2Q4_00750, partial [Geminicoccaceae bacterium]
MPRLGRSPVPEIESKPFSSKTQTADGDDQDQAATSSETPPAPDDPEIVDGGIHDLELGGGEQSGLDIELFESEVLLPAIGEHAAPSSDAVEDPETSKEPAAGNDGGNAVEDSLHDDMLSELGADDFIDDPIAPEALSQAVQTLPSEADEESAEPTVGAPSTDFEQGTDGEEWQHAGREPHEPPPLETGRGGDQADGSQEESSAPAIDPEAPDAAVDIKLDWPALVALGFVDPRDPKRPLPSNMDKIARALVRQALSDQSSWRDRVILVTSAEEHKIKSDAAINFAFALTTIDRHSVVLLDANMSHAGSAKRLGAPNARGLTSALCDDDLDVGELVLKANLDRLTLMASGPAEDEILDRFASRRMLNVLRYLTKDPDTLLVIDAPPILISQEAAVLAVIAGQVILAVEAGKTTADAIDHALKR